MKGNRTLPTPARGYVRARWSALRGHDIRLPRCYRLLFVPPGSISVCCGERDWIELPCLFDLARTLSNARLSAIKSRSRMGQAVHIEGQLDIGSPESLFFYTSSSSASRTHETKYYNEKRIEDRAYKCKARLSVRPTKNTREREKQSDQSNE